MKKIERTQTDTLTYVASSAGIAGDVEKIGALTRVVATVELVPSAALGGTNQPDGIWRLLSNLRILGGSNTYFTLPGGADGHGGTLLHYLNGVDHGGMMGVSRGTILAPQRTYTPVTFVLHPGSRPRMWGRENPFDLTAFIPAGAESQLRVEWATLANTVLDDVTLITSAVMRFNLHYVEGTHSEIQQEMARQGVQLPLTYLQDGGERPITGMMPSWTSEVISPTATATEYSNERNIPTGYYMKRISVLSNDDTAAPRALRAQDEVTGIRVHIDGQEVVKSFVDGWTGMLGPVSVDEVDDAALDFGNHAGFGVHMKDLRPHGNADYGLNLRNVNNGAARLGFTITTNATGDDILILYEGYKPYYGLLG